MSAARPTSIVNYWLLIVLLLVPSAALLGVCVTLGARDLVALAFPPDVTRGQAKPIESATATSLSRGPRLDPIGETVTREVRQIEGRPVECVRTEDHINNTKSLSC